MKRTMKKHKGKYIRTDRDESSRLETDFFLAEKYEEDFEFLKPWQKERRRKKRSSMETPEDHTSEAWQTPEQGSAVYNRTGTGSGINGYGDRLPLSQKLKPGDRVVNANEGNRRFMQTGIVLSVGPESKHDWKAIGAKYNPVTAKIRIEITGEVISAFEAWWFPID